jgi:peptidoglycan/xylan/chitin deacetylase (PgdA/CDA1 family)
MVKRWLTSVLSYQQAERLRSLAHVCLYYSGLAWLAAGPKRRSATVFVYHSVGATDVFADNVVPAEIFDKQMRLLARRRKPVALQQIVAELRAGREPPADWVAVTFDDGYRDFLTTALPILDRHKIPVSIFVPTAVLHGNALFFDLVERVITESAATRIGLQTSKGSVDVELGERASRSDAALRVALVLRELEPQERARAYADLQAQCRVPAPTIAAGTYLSAADLADLPPWVEVGSHSINHYCLAALDDATLQIELVHSRTELRASGAHAAEVLAYPFGKPWSFDDRVKNAAAGAGYLACLTTMNGAIRSTTGPMAIPRAGATSSIVRMKLNLLGLYV